MRWRRRKEVSARPLSIYVHVPFCASRCGYCDFNTYTATELGDAVSRDTFHRVLIEEVRMAATDLRAQGRAREVQTVFFGGGTPTLIGPSALGEVLQSIRDELGLAPGAEVTTEANPDSIDQAGLDALLAAGFTRISLGMQSSASHVLRILDRTHTPGRSVAMARAARRAGFAHVSLDLIYGTPGESDADLRGSLDAVLDSGVDHVSAYALIVEDGTPLARRIARGELSMPDDDIAASRYELIDDALVAAGLDWYEVSNWAKPAGQCRHNIAYWRSDDWWGIGPGAHSHLGGVRWWNAKHPRTYADALSAGQSPRSGIEHLTEAERRTERVMLAMRMRSGLPVAELGDGHDRDGTVIDRLRGRGLVDASALDDGRLVLTRPGRLLADAVIREILDAASPDQQG
ncbi:MAG: coproporphyrinogen III oxidase [Actinomycetales bacterium]|nr:coproporphyrinogen III oxidase [Actinomycetales bacterium]